MADSSEWEQFVQKIGLLTISMGALEAAIMSMHCRAIGIAESELKSRLNRDQRKGLLRAVTGLDWPEAQKAELRDRLKAIAALDDRRNKFIHISVAVVSDDSLPDIPPGSVINLRSYGLGVMARTPNSATFGLVADRIHLAEIDLLTEEIHQARLGLVPFMELIDKIQRSPQPLEEFHRRIRRTPVGKRLV